jgi:hypothetical protein
MKVNKISMKRYEEQLNRGFDILTNEPIENEDVQDGGDSNKEQQEAAASKT